MPSTDADAKRQFIEAYFDELAGKIPMLMRLSRDGHKDDARLLACCYIEALGNWLQGSTSVGASNFVYALKHFTDNNQIGLILLPLLRESLPFKNLTAAARPQLETALSALPQDEALSKEELLNAMRPTVSEAAVDFLRREAWRGTVASYVYGQMRSPAAHWGGSAGALTFSRTTYRGGRLRKIDFFVLKAALEQIIAHARTVSLETNKWFGHF